MSRSINISSTNSTNLAKIFSTNPIVLALPNPYSSLHYLYPSEYDIYLTSLDFPSVESHNNPYPTLSICPSQQFCKNKVCAYDLVVLSPGKEQSVQDGSSKSILG
jgi:hypothetical protein